MLGGMFDTLPGVSAPVGDNQPQGLGHSVNVRNFGRVGGMTPRRILEDSCRSRDSRAKITYKQISATTYSCRHSIVIDWTQEQEIQDSSYLQPVSIQSKLRQLKVSMIREATPDVLQSESYVATAALFVVFSNSPKEEKSHLKLPPAYRDLWNEFSQLKHAHIDSLDRQTVQELRSLVEKHAVVTEDEDDEVVFNAHSRLRSGLASGTSTPASRPHTPKPGVDDISQSLKEMWNRKTTTSSYQRMLLSRMNLPMWHSKAVAMETIQRNQVTIIVGDTGACSSSALFTPNRICMIGSCADIRISL